MPPPHQGGCQGLWPAEPGSRPCQGRKPDAWHAASPSSSPAAVRVCSRLCTCTHLGSRSAPVPGSLAGCLLSVSVTATLPATLPAALSLDLPGAPPRSLVWGSQPLRTDVGPVVRSPPDDLMPQRALGLRLDVPV
ncbi:unnamed protein product [Rangifer tarandus platyrhynchus]|uniref:Uncharacterized protein n=2 Tax=Rangifer tarandus platyrhynchus TaxID=3082113 RepID=A0ABN8Y7Y1_RANTA|nr:unnamed protein product [Rangifer tarandus platyrhynchus]